MSDPILEALASIDAGSVLDVATGSGGFIDILMDGLIGFDEIIGIDSQDKTEVFAEKYKDQPSIHFLQMDATRLSFADGSFDTVSISNSLHHFDHPQQVLEQMTRVLRPGGRLIVSEMVRDAHTDSEMTHVLLHHWWAAVDRSTGVVHHETFTRTELVSLVSTLGLKEVSITESVASGDDPFDSELIKELDSVFEQYLKRAAGNEDLLAQGAALKEQVQKHGFNHAPSFLIIVEKK